MSRLLEDPLVIFERACEKAETLERTSRGGEVQSRPPFDALDYSKSDC